MAADHDLPPGFDKLVFPALLAIVFRTVGGQVSLWESALPAGLLTLPAELAGVDALLDDSAFFAPFVPYFDPRIGRPSTPMETYLRMMFLKFRYQSLTSMSRVDGSVFA